MDLKRVKTISLKEGGIKIKITVKLETECGTLVPDERLRLLSHLVDGSMEIIRGAPYVDAPLHRMEVL